MFFPPLPPAPRRARAAVPGGLPRGWKEDGGAHRHPRLCRGGAPHAAAAPRHDLHAPSARLLGWMPGLWGSPGGACWDAVQPWRPAADGGLRPGCWAQLNARRLRHLCQPRPLRCPLCTRPAIRRSARHAQCSIRYTPATLPGRCRARTRRRLMSWRGRWRQRRRWRTRQSDSSGWLVLPPTAGAKPSTCQLPTQWRQQQQPLECAECQPLLICLSCAALPGM